MQTQTTLGQTFTSHRERRASVRRAANQVPVRVETSVLSEPFEGQVLDRSEGGLRLVVGRQISVGITLRVKPAHAGNRTVWVEVNVVYCLSWGDRWILGCQFLTPPPADALALLG